MADPQDAGLCANAEQAALWDGPAGDHRIRHNAVFEAEDRRHNARFREAAAVGPRDRVLDIGCGTGKSTREAARAATSGSALGVDLSARMLAEARRLAAGEGLHNVTFRQADAQVHRFQAEYFDLCVSRFGSMFFADPAAAFANIGHALRPGARLVLLVWQARDRNEWSVAIRETVLGDTSAPASPAFSLADPAVAEAILDSAGFSGIGFTDVHEPVSYGPDAAVAFDMVSGMRSTVDMLAGLDAGQAERALERLRVMLAARETADGVLFDSRTWIVTARRAPQ
jgi:SAM-dependent methyltransferase